MLINNNNDINNTVWYVHIYTENKYTQYKRDKKVRILKINNEPKN